MVLNRNTDRRRRLLVDANSSTGEAATQRQPASANPGSDNEGLLDVRRAYAIGAHRRHQRKITDLIPKRPLAYSAAIGIIALLLLAINVLAYFSPNWKSVIGTEGVAALALVGPQSITTWLATIFLATTAALCLQVYALRQHRSDDYEGSYRIWAWLSLVLAVASLACVVPITAIAGNIFSAVTGREFATSWLPSAIGITFASLLLVRYLMEVRASYGTVAWASLAWLAISLRISSPEMLTAILPESIDQNQASDFAWGNGLFVAAAATLLANVTYGRFVFLRSNGFIASAPKRIEQKSESESNSLSLRERWANNRAARKQAAADRRAERRAAKAASQEQSNATATSIAASKEQAADNAESAATATPARPKAKPKTKKRTTTKSNTPAQPKVAVETQAASSSKKAKPAASVQQESQPEILKMSSSVGKPANDSSKTISDSASAKLKQLADAARAKSVAADPATDESAPTIKKLSKSERRRQRKNQRQQKRAA